MNRPQRTNNPGNLRYAGQAGAIADEHGMCKFDYAWEGWIALIKQIKLDQSRGLTFKQFVNKYAPPSENNTTNYLQFVTGGLAVSHDSLLSSISPFAIAGLIAQIEGYFAQ